jgi:hypothetical protein
MISGVALYPNREREAENGCSIANRVGRPKVMKIGHDQKLSIEPADTYERIMPEVCTKV